MKPKTIGIVGGAGPIAGAFLLERLLTLSMSRYGCARDADFPKVLLISYPFSAMLAADLDALQIKKELQECLTVLRQNGASVLAIACNTLHAFLDENEADLIHLPRTVAEVIPSDVTPLVLCTSTAVRFALHQRFFPCHYPEIRTQEEVDQIIDMILKGKAIKEKLSAVLEGQVASHIILGCTELSLFAKELAFCTKQLIDPLEILAVKILEQSFKQRCIK